MTTKTMIVPEVFTMLASDEQIERTMLNLESNNIRAFIANSGVEAREKLLELLPQNAEVFVAKSGTLDTMGLTKFIDQSGLFNSVRSKISLMDPESQKREMQKMSATPEYILGSVHALTETGSAIIASATGSQLAGYASGAAHVIWIVGTQKIVPNLEAGFRRLELYSLPMEDARIFAARAEHSSINKLLVVHKEYEPGRTTVILVKENLGF